jgi:hypothetical protein
MIVYSVNIGNKDRICEPVIKHPRCEYVYIVDNAEGYESDIWDIREMPRRYDDTTTESRWYKMHPHLMFPGEATAYVDANYQPRANNPIPMLISDLVGYTHTASRTCLYDEARVCLDRNIGNAPEIKRQIAEYRKEGMPEQWGMIMGSILYREPTVGEFNEMWWDQFRTYNSQRDQLSLQYCMWKTGIDFHRLSFSVLGYHFGKAGRHLFHGTRD